MLLDAKATAATIEALQLLAADAKVQVKAFPDYVLVADELALTLHDAVLLLRQEAANENVAAWFVESVTEIDNALDSYSRGQDSQFWSNESLEVDLRWQRVRLAAREILSRLGLPRSFPTLDADYIRSPRR